MARQRKGHILKFEDGGYYTETGASEGKPYSTDNPEDAELYFKYFDLMEAQAKVKGLTGKETVMAGVSFQVTDLTFR